MKEKFCSIFSLWKKYKTFLCLNLTIILALTLIPDLTAAGSVGGDSDEYASQQVTVRGVVTDGATGDAMPGVNVIVTGTTTGTMTDASGAYILEVPNGS